MSYSRNGKHGTLIKTSAAAVRIQEHVRPNGSRPLGERRAYYMQVANRLAKIGRRFGANVEQRREMRALIRDLADSHGIKVSIHK